MPFAPVVAIELSTPLPKGRPAITATVTQADGESSISSVDIVFPKRFGFNERFHPKRCMPKEEADEDCPAASRIGSVAADSPLAQASGDIFVTKDLRIVAFVQALGGLIRIKVTGVVRVTDADQFAVSFTGLPNGIPLRSVTLSLAGGDLALLKNPKRCGTYRFPSRFLSYKQEVAESVPTATISGCASRG